MIYLLLGIIAIAVVFGPTVAQIVVGMGVSAVGAVVLVIVGAVVLFAIGMALLGLMQPFLAAGRKVDSGLAKRGRIKRARARAAELNAEPHRPSEAAAE